MSKEVRCLAVRQPYAWAISTGEKNIENRTRKTDYRGPVIIHASTAKTYVNELIKADGNKLPAEKFQYGAMIGVVDLIDIVPLSEELESNPWAHGPYCWKMANARLFKRPIPAKGKLNLFRLSESLGKKALKAAETAVAADLGAKDQAWIDAMTNYSSEENRIYGLYRSYLDLNDLENCLRLADKALEKFPNLDWHIDRGLVLFYSGDFNRSLEELNHVVSEDNSAARAYLIRSLVHQELGNANQANKDKEKAIELDPDFAETQDD